MKTNSGYPFNKNRINFVATNMKAVSLKLQIYWSIMIPNIWHVFYSWYSVCCYIRMFIAYQWYINSNLSKNIQGDLAFNYKLLWFALNNIDNINYNPTKLVILLAHAPVQFITWFVLIVPCDVVTLLICFVPNVYSSVPISVTVQPSITYDIHIKYRYGTLLTSCYLTNRYLRYSFSIHFYILWHQPS